MYGIEKLYCDEEDATRWINAVMALHYLSCHADGLVFLNVLLQYYLHER